jgi:hypothetical protein
MLDRKLFAMVALVGAVALTAVGAGTADASAGASDSTVTTRSVAHDTGSLEWHDMGHYGPGWEYVCQYNRAWYEAVRGRGNADCVWNGNGVTLWVNY